MVTNLPLLTILTFLPLAGALCLVPAWRSAAWARRVALVFGAGELLLQAVAGALALAGLAIAHYRYGGKRREERIAAAAGPTPGMVSFLLNGWRFDDLYRLLFIRPYEWIARIFWERVDEGVIDDSLDRLADVLGWSGQGLGRWTTGRVSVYLLSFAAGLAAVLAWLAWRA